MYSFGYKLVCCYDNKYSKPVKTYRGTDAVYKFMKKMLEEVKWCQKMKKKHFNKDMVMTDEDTAQASIRRNTVISATSGT